MRRARCSLRDCEAPGRSLAVKRISRPSGNRSGRIGLLSFPSYAAWHSRCFPKTPEFVQHLCNNLSKVISFCTTENYLEDRFV